MSLVVVEGRGARGESQVAHCRACGFVGPADVGLCPKCGSAEWFKGRPRETVNPTPLLCRSKVRALFLDTAKRERPFNKFTRVSEDTLVQANEVLRAWCVQHVKRMPSKGQTL